MDRLVQGTYIVEKTVLGLLGGAAVGAAAWLVTGNRTVGQVALVVAGVTGAVIGFARGWEQASSYAETQRVYRAWRVQQDLMDIRRALHSFEDLAIYECKDFEIQCSCGTCGEMVMVEVWRTPPQDDARAGYLVDASCLEENTVDGLATMRGVQFPRDACSSAPDLTLRILQHLSALMPDEIDREIYADKHHIKTWLQQRLDQWNEVTAQPIERYS